MCETHNHHFVSHVGKKVMIELIEVQTETAAGVFGIER